MEIVVTASNNYIILGFCVVVFQSLVTTYVRSFLHS